MITWKTTMEEFDLITQIASRAVENSRRVGDKYSMQSALMDINATHCNGCPLDLAGLLNADPYTFSHDVYGIRQHINRDTGKLENCFIPRCAARGASD